MTWFTGVAAYVVIWWLVIFTILPWGVRPAEDEMGLRAGAPANPRLRLKALITTGIAAVLWGILYLIVSSDIWSFRQP
jgi:predicted secreted protein